MRYFFDVDDGHVQTLDDEGLEFATFTAMKASAVQALQAIVKDAQLGEAGERAFTMHVRDPAGEVIFTAAVIYSAECLCGR